MPGLVLVLEDDLLFSPRIEMGLQASVYERQGLADLSEFYHSAIGMLSAPELRAILDELVSLRAFE